MTGASADHLHTCVGGPRTLQRMPRGEPLRRCLDCQNVATHRGRCAVHFVAYERRGEVRARRKRRALTARAYDAAARLRALITEAGYVRCAGCGRRFPATSVEVDHVRPLSRGGMDVRGNVQILCRSCHQFKTRADL